ncbi:MAG: penicillin-binding protein 2 [Chloroflexi bacterium]|nr:penicillin-binding protein 2 [Chloroflexota bacterium]
MTQQTSGLARWRLILVVLLLGGGTLALMWQMARLQLVEHEKYQKQAEREHWVKVPIVPDRGTIRDANGHPLAIAVSTFDVFVNGDFFQSRQRAEALGRLLEMSPETIMSRKLERGEKERLVAASVSYQRGVRIKEQAIVGVEVREKMERVYPEDSLAASVLGFVGRDNVGLTGLEKDLNLELGGVAGMAVYEGDSLHRPIPIAFRQVQPPKGGVDVILTIDRYVQRLVESQLDKAVAKHRAKGGTIIVMNPKTGAILAMASRPTFDLARLNLADNAQSELYRNRATTDMYEPGSVLKILTMAGALDEKLITPNTAFMDNGPVVKYGWTIDTWNGRHHGRETMTQVLQNSCNVGAVWISDLLGPERFYKYMKRFGLGQPTYVELSGESPGVVRTDVDPGWRPIDLATNSFGQGIAITPLQLATAVSAVANGGLLMRPHLVKAVRGEVGVRTFEPVVVRRVISPEAAKQLTEMMRAAAEDGESKLAIVPDYHIAGKTGTASISGEGGYTQQSTIASFVGFAPYNDPEILVLVKIDEPQDEPWGSLVASPVFSAITRDLLTYFRIPPTAMVAAQGTR